MPSELRLVVHFSSLRMNMDCDASIRSWKPLPAFRGPLWPTDETLFGAFWDFFRALTLDGLIFGRVALSRALGVEMSGGVYSNQLSARGPEGFSGADCAALLREAATAFPSSIPNRDPPGSVLTYHPPPHICPPPRRAERMFFVLVDFVLHAIYVPSGGPGDWRWCHIRGGPSLPNKVPDGDGLEPTPEMTNDSDQRAFVEPMWTRRCHFVFQASLPQSGGRPTPKYGPTQRQTPPRK